MFLAVPVRSAGTGSTNHAEMMRVWRAADRLPSDSVTAILQTRDGFMWIGTSAGLARFDGMKFTELKLADATTNEAVRVTALCQDAAGHLWIGTQSYGLFEFAEGILRHFGRQQGLLDDNVTSLAADSHGQIWIGGKLGLKLWTGRKFKYFTTHDGLSDEFVSYVNVARSGAVWITTRVGMCRFLNGRIVPFEFQTESQGRSPEYLGAYEDQRGNIWAFGDTYLINLAEGKRFNYFRDSESASVRIWSLCEGRDGRLWIGTSGRGLYCFEENRFHPVMLGEGYAPFDVRAICEDDQGNLWLGTSAGGLVQLRVQTMHVLRASRGLPESPVTALAVDAGGEVFVGLQRGGLFAGGAERFDRVGGSDELPLQHFISSLCVTSNGTLWAGTLGDGLVGWRNGRVIHFTTADGLADNTVPAVCADKNGGVWAATAAGAVHYLRQNKIFRFSPGGDLLEMPVTAMIPAADGGLWLGTQNGRILRCQNGKFRQVLPMEKSPHSAVLSLHEGQNRLWIGTDGEGLFCVSNGIVTSWNVSNGLPGGIVAGAVLDGRNNLWLATDAGIYCVKDSDLRQALNDPHVPLACQLTSGARTAPNGRTLSGGPRAVLSPDGKLWFATSDGVLAVDAHLAQVESPDFPTYLESVAFNNQPPISLLRGELWSRSGHNGISLEAPGDLRSLEVHFTALDFAAPEQVRFRHKLDGFDSDWVDDAGDRSARYGRLPYGNYRFHLCARAADAQWREAPEVFSFVVPTPIYFQTWAIGLYAVAAIALIAGVVRMVSHRRLRLALAHAEQQQALERERMRIARDMHDEMGSKLTKISFLSERAEMEAAAGPVSKYTTPIAETSRQLLKTMDQIVWVVNPRNDTLENLTAYLCQYAMEYFQNTSVECEVRLPPEIPHHPLSSEQRHNVLLTFEEALNNLLKHSGASRVKVEISVTAFEFDLTISDNGKGFDLAAPSHTRGGRGGNGLKNMRQRLSVIGGECLVTSRAGAGTTITFRVPLAKTTVRQS